MIRLSLGLTLAGLLATPSLRAQPATTPGSGTATPPLSGAPALDEPLGKFHLGPLYVTPRFRLGPIGFDTNVFYTPTDRQADFLVTLGPGLDVVLPLGGRGRFYTGGYLDYLYFVRTPSQRRLTGAGVGGLSFKGTRTEAGIEERYGTTFSRPSYEVNERVEQQAEGTEAWLARRLRGRLGLAFRGRRLHNETTTTDYLGVDLGEALTYDLQQLEVEASLALSPKTSFVSNATVQRNRYPLDAERDADRGLLAGGFRTDSTALVSGRLLLGVRTYKLQAAGATEQRAFYADIDETLNLSARTRIGVSYFRDITDSIFVPEVGTPSNRTESVGARIEKDLLARVYLRIFGRWVKNTSDGAITVEVPDEGAVTAVREDRVREAGSELGYRFRPNLRIGVLATYSDRDSTIAYFGVQGLMVGLNAQYNP